MWCAEAKDYLWANLTKRASTHLYCQQGPAGLWFSVVNLILKHVQRICETLSLKSQYLFFFYNIHVCCYRNEPKQTPHGKSGVKLCKTKGQCTKNRTQQMYRIMSRTVFTHNLALSRFSQLLPQYLLPLLPLQFCLNVQLGLSLWPQELDKPLVERSLTAAI